MKLYMWSSINDVKDVGVYDSVTKIIERCGGLNSIKIIKYTPHVEITPMQF